MRAWLEEAEALDHAVYGAVAATASPRLDRALSRLSRAADHSKLSITASAILAVAAGPRGRQAARAGLVAVAATSASVNLVAKPIGRRRRPERPAEVAPLSRQVEMPSSRSFPSGHAAAAVAFASGAGRVLPAAGIPLHGLAALVAYSRVHTGVHYPADVIAGTLIGAVMAEFTSAALASRNDLRTRK